jgi:hypothetical protein
VKTVFATEFATGLQRVGIGASNILKSLARRKGFEPLTPRFEVCTKLLIILTSVPNIRCRGAQPY